VQDLRYYVPGIMLILVAVMIFAVPQILVVLVGTLILMAGIGALHIGHKIKKSEAEFRRFGESFFDDGPHGWRFMRVPLYRRRWDREF